jgi:hypothetical protein
MRPSPTASRIALAIGAVGALGLALYLRTRNAAQVYLPDAVLLSDTDCYYHLRRALLCLTRFPWVSVVDPWLSWPDGAKPTWGPGFDVLLALPAWLVGAREGLAASRALTAVPVLLGLVVVAATARLARSLEPDPARRDPVTLAAAVLAAAMPQAILLSELGATDHHVVEALAPALLLPWALRPPRDNPRSALAWEARGALLLTALAWLFPGTVMTHGLVAAGMALRALVLPPQRRTPGALAFLAAAILLGALAAPWTALHGDTFHHLQLSLLQPLLLALGGAFLALLGLGPSLASTAPARALTRLLGAVAGLSLIVGALALALPAVRREVVAGVMDWLFTRDPWMATIAECLPPFPRGRPWADSLGTVWRTQGFAGPLLPVFGVLCLLRVARRGEGPRAATALPLATVLVGLVALALTQCRFFRGLSGVVPAVTALGLAELASFLPLRSPATAGRVTLALCAGALALDPPTRATFSTRAGPSINGVLDAALHLRPQRPVARGRGDGVLAPWDLSFEMLTLGQRPVVVSGFGPYLNRPLLTEAEGILTRDEAALVDFLQRRDAGFVLAVGARVLTANGSVALPPTRRSADGRIVLNAAMLRARPLAALALGGSGNASAGVAHLGQLRPCFADRALLGGVHVPLPAVWVYERVAGATLHGDAPDGALVTADLAMQHHGLVRAWQGWTRATGGRWSMRVPLATGMRAYGVHTGPRYTVRAGGLTLGAVAVSDDEVRRGRRVEVAVAP